MSNLINVIRAAVAGEGAGAVFAGSSSQHFSGSRYEQGYAEGYAAETERLRCILGDPSIKEDPGRMSAALQLAVQSPNMQEADVVSFVVNNVGSAKPGMTYAQRRIMAANAASSVRPGQSSSLIADAVAETNAKRGMGAPAKPDTRTGEFSKIVAESIVKTNGGRRG